MRIIVFFDLPTVAESDKKEYLRFRKHLLSEGFIMMQESVYTKLALNSTSAELIKTKVKNERPKDGLVQVLTITEKQYASIEYICGSSQKTIIDSESRLIIL